MTNYMSLRPIDSSRIVEAVASWLQYEQLCKRVGLFGESYLTYPVGQFLQARVPDKVRSEFPHPALNESKSVPGDKKRIDYVVLGENKTIDFAVETKWCNKSNTLTESILQDFIRLNMLVSKQDTTALFIFGGLLGKLDSLFFKKKALIPDENDPQSKYLFPVEEKQFKRAISLKTNSTHRAKLMMRTVAKFQNLELPVAINVTKIGPFPKDGRKNQVAVYGFQINKHVCQTFKPSNFYDYKKR